jgi:hypothetical protein
VRDIRARKAERLQQRRRLRAEHFTSNVAEHALGRRIPLGDPSFQVPRDDGDRQLVELQFKPMLSLAQLFHGKIPVGDVPADDDHAMLAGGREVRAASTLERAPRSILMPIAQRGEDLATFVDGDEKGVGAPMDVIGVQQVDQERPDDLVRFEAEHVSDARACIENSAARGALDDDVERIVEQRSEALFRMCAGSVRYPDRGASRRGRSATSGTGDGII